MTIEIQGCTITHNRNHVFTVHCPDGTEWKVSTWAEAMEVIDAWTTMLKPKTALKNSP